MPRHVRDTRQAIVQAASTEFAARGFAATPVDRIARRAGVNKAMIYYHFGSKQQLYCDIVREIVLAIRGRTDTIAAGDTTAERKIEAFIEAFVSEAQSRPHMPPIMMREVAEGGRHLDALTLRVIVGVFKNLLSILDEGRQTGAFRRVHPLLLYFTIVGPTVMFLAGGPIRDAIARLGVINLPKAGPTVLVEYLKAVAGRMLRPASRSARTRDRATESRRRRSRATSSRSGDQA